MKAVLALLSACAIPHITAHAQSLPAVVMKASPLTHQREGQVQGCGVRLTGGEPSVPVSSWFDVSFNLFRRGIGIAQSIAYEIKRSEYHGENRPARIPVQTTWIRAGEGSTRLGENIERKESLIYLLLTDDVLTLFEAVADGQPVTIGIRRWGQSVDAVYTAAPIVGPDAREQIGACLAGLVLDQ